MARTSGTVREVSAWPYEHENYHDFCTVCGSVWPCAAAMASGTISSTTFTMPVPRAFDL